MQSNIKIEGFIIDDRRSFKYGEKANNYITDTDYINFRRMKIAVDVTPFDKWNGIEVAYLDYLAAVHIIPEKVFLSDIDDDHRWMTFSYYHRDPETHKCDYETTDSRFNDDTPEGRQFHIIQLIMYLAEYEYDIDVEGNSLTKSSITFDSYINYSDNSSEQTWMLIRGLMSNYIVSTGMIDTYNQFLKERELMNKDNTFVNVDPSNEEINENTEDTAAVKSYNISTSGVGVNYVSRLEFIETIKEAMEKEDDPVDFERDTYNGVPIKCLMEFIMVGCIPRFVRVHKEFPGMAIVIVDVPSIKDPDEHYERCEFLIKDDVEGGFYSYIMKIITDNIMPNYLEVSIDDLDKDISTMALECCNRPNPAWANARFITYLTRRIKLLEAQRFMASEESDDNTSSFNWSDLELDDEYNIPDEMFLSQDVQDKYDAAQDFLNNKLDMFKDIDTSNKDHIFNDINKPELFSRAEDDNVIAKGIIQDANTITTNASKYDIDAIMKAVDYNKNKTIKKHDSDAIDALRYASKAADGYKDSLEVFSKDVDESIINDIKDVAEFCKKNKDADAGVVSAIVMKNIVVFTYKIGDVTKVSIGRDIGYCIELLHDKKHTKIDKKFVDKIYHVEDNVIDILKIIFNLK